MYSSRVSGLRIERDLKCKNGCGFYGNAQCDMLCSKCYREKIVRERQVKGRFDQYASEQLAISCTIAWFNGLIGLCYSRSEETKRVAVEARGASGQIDFTRRNQFGGTHCWSCIIVVVRCATLESKWSQAAKETKHFGGVQEAVTTATNQGRRKFVGKTKPSSCRR